MDFTREPIVETVMTPREGFRLVVRSSKNLGTEEHFVDALEVITFGSNCFFRNIERPKSFLLPVSDYEVLEVREPKIILKSPSIEGAVKIGGGRSEAKNFPPQREMREREPRESREREGRESQSDRREVERREAERRDIGKEPVYYEAPDLIDSDQQGSEHLGKQLAKQQEIKQPVAALAESGRPDRRRDRRRTVRPKGKKGTGREGAAGDISEEESGIIQEEPQSPELTPPHVQTRAEIEMNVDKQRARAEADSSAPPILSSILPPPTTLIRDDIARLKANELYKGAFYMRDEVDVDESDDEPVAPFVATPDESEEESFEDYRARPEPVVKDSSAQSEPSQASVPAAHSNE